MPIPLVAPQDAVTDHHPARLPDDSQAIRCLSIFLLVAFLLPVGILFSQRYLLELYIRVPACRDFNERQIFMICAWRSQATLVSAWERPEHPAVKPTIIAASGNLNVDVLVTLSTGARRVIHLTDKRSLWLPAEYDNARPSFEDELLALPPGTVFEVSFVGSRATFLRAPIQSPLPNKHFSTAYTTEHPGYIADRLLPKTLGCLFATLAVWVVWLLYRIVIRLNPRS